MSAEIVAVLFSPVMALVIIGIGFMLNRYIIIPEHPWSDSLSASDVEIRYGYLPRAMKVVIYFLSQVLTLLIWALGVGAKTYLQIYWLFGIVALGMIYTTPGMPLWVMFWGYSTAVMLAVALLWHMVKSYDESYNEGRTKKNY